MKELERKKVTLKASYSERLCESETAAL
jgi:Auxin canalisation